MRQIFKIYNKSRDKWEEDDPKDRLDPLWDDLQYHHQDYSTNGHQDHLGGGLRDDLRESILDIISQMISKINSKMSQRSFVSLSSSPTPPPPPSSNFTPPPPPPRLLLHLRLYFFSFLVIEDAKQNKNGN